MLWFQHFTECHFKTRNVVVKIKREHITPKTFAHSSNIAQGCDDAFSGRFYEREIIGDGICPNSLFIFAPLVDADPKESTFIFAACRLAG